MATPKKMAIATCTPESTISGIEIATSGGNAIDAAIAAAFTLTVSDILMTSLGGGGFAIIKDPDNNIEIIDFFDVMPGKGLDIDYHRKHTRPKKVPMHTGIEYTVLTGHATIAVPGVVKGLEAIINRHGSMPLDEVIDPSIHFARNGVKFTKTVYDCFLESYDSIHWQSEYEKSILSINGTDVPQIGDTIIQEDLANTLELIGQYGSDVFYKGEIAEAILKEVQSGGGLLTAEDLASYEAIIRKPLESSYKGRKIWTNPPPSVGGATLIEMLKLLSHYDLKDKLSPQDITLLGKIQHQALRDKFEKYIDPNTNEEVAKELLSDEYILKTFKKIAPPPHTSHISVIDDTGYAIGITMSMGYDSGVAIPGTGIFMANSLGEIDLNPGGYLGYNPGDRLISAMTPIIMQNEEQTDLLVTGSAGSSRIPTSLMQLIMNIVDYDKNLLDALYTKRFHYDGCDFSLEPGLEIDKSLLPEDIKINKFNEIYKFFGGTQCARFKNNEILEAYNDPRRSGSAQTIII